MSGNKLVLIYEYNKLKPNEILMNVIDISELEEKVHTAKLNVTYSKYNFIEKEIKNITFNFKKGFFKKRFYNREEAKQKLNRNTRYRAKMIEYDVQINILRSAYKELAKKKYDFIIINNTNIKFNSKSKNDNVYHIYNNMYELIEKWSLSEN